MDRTRLTGWHVLKSGSNSNNGTKAGVTYLNANISLDFQSFNIYTNVNCNKRLEGFMPKKDKYQITKSELLELHHNQLKTPSEIAEILGCSYSTVLFKMKKYGIQKLPKVQWQYGKRYGKLVVEDFSHIENRNAVWRCKCDCGNIVYITTGRLKFNSQCSLCGKSNRKTHGLSGTYFYKVWQGMKTRCSNKNAINYERYGGRGISYDPRWESFKNFYNDMFDTYEKGLTIERIDNNKGYFKENCKWVTPKEQNLNMRTNILLTYKDKTQTITEWAEELCVNRSKLYAMKTSYPNLSDEKIIQKTLQNDRVSL